MKSSARSLAMVLVTALVGCAARQVDDPSFAVSYADAERALATMRTQPATRPTLGRPVVILDGIGSWGRDAARLKERIAERADGTIVTVCFPFDRDFDQCRRHVLDALDRGLATDGGASASVDVIGLSLGGVVARYASLDDGATPGRRLNVHRLFTVASPLQGARLADRLGWISPVRMHRDLRSTSAFYQRLAGAAAAYPVVSYSRLDDRIVGARHASMPGAGVYWLANRRGEHAHFGVMDDARVVADLLRRLRSEPPLTAATTSPLPDGFD